MLGGRVTRRRGWGGHGCEQCLAFSTVALLHGYAERVAREHSACTGATGQDRLILTYLSQIISCVTVVNFDLQVLPCQHLLQPASGESPEYLQRLRSLAFSTYSQSRRLLPRQTHIRSLTGFGPASTIQSTLNSPEVRLDYIVSELDASNVL